MTEPKRIGDLIPDRIEKHIGIPTNFRGVVYRSRLEARWAAFFRLLGWRADYEPFDLDGWIPDFLLGETLVEVKPLLASDRKWRSVRAKCHGSMRAMGDVRDVLYVGVGPFLHAELNEPCIGTLDRYVEIGSDRAWAAEDALLGRIDGEAWGVRGSENWIDVISGGHCKTFATMDDVLGIWGTACNLTQWKPAIETEAKQ